MPFTAEISVDLSGRGEILELKQFCSLMGLSVDAEQLLKKHWEKLVAAWGGKVPGFVSEEYLKKYLPFLQVPQDEEEIMLRARRVIASCCEKEERSLYMFALYYGAFVLKLQVNPAMASPVWGEDEGVACLIASLSCFPLIAENCRKKEIPEHYATDVLQWIGGTVAIYKLAHNDIPGHSLQQLYWLHHHIDGDLYRIGRFEYLIHHLPAWAPLIFRNDDGVLAILAAPGFKFDEKGLVTLKEPYVESTIEEDGFCITGIPCTAELYASLLRGAPDKSVTLLCVGLLSAVYEFLKNEPDLFEKKVKQAVIMGNPYKKNDFNLSMDA